MILQRDSIVRVELPERLIRTIQLCQRCNLWRTRKFPVPGRGIAPSDVLFIGEGPGKVEDVRGLAFIGPTKRIINDLIIHASREAGVEVPNCFYANLVCCRPCDSRLGDNRPPSGEEAWACWPNLKAVAEAVNPRLVVLLGKVPVTYAQACFPMATTLLHPAYILRVGGIDSQEHAASIRRLSDAFKMRLTK